jgi:23S rRNA (uracil1939-C5)-methyltransferase
MTRLDPAGPHARRRAAEAARPRPLAPGQRLQLEVQSLAAEGDGVGRHEGLAVFVPQAAPGDLLEVEVTECAARYARARIVRLLRPGPDRVTPPCPIFADCGGCAWQHLAYPAQLRWKRTIVCEALRRLGHVPEPEALVRPTLPADPPWRYRHKMAVPFAPPARPGEPPRAGFYAARSHRIVPLESCLIQHPLLDRALAETRRLAAALGVPAYDEGTRRGELRHLVGRVSHSTGQLLLCLVTARARVPWARPLAQGLMAAIPECVGVVQNIHAGPGNAILGPVTRPLVGCDRLLEVLDGLRFWVSAPSFFQVSPVQAAALYRTAVGQAALAGSEQVLELYAGVGTLSLFLARKAGRVEAVEEVAEAVADGRHNIAANGIRNLRLHCGTAEELVPALLARGFRPDVAVLDPPRKGAAASVLQAVARAGPRRIVYVSCNPATLARDVELLRGWGYGLREVQPVDMFPQTPHVECSALLEREG